MKNEIFFLAIFSFITFISNNTNKLINKNQFDTINFCNINLNDTSSVTLKIFYNGIMECEVKNNSSDTILLLINPFIIQGDTCFSKSSHIWVGVGKRYTSPNILYYSKKGETINFIADGEYESNFCIIPDLLLIAPEKNTILSYKIDEKYRNIFDACEMQFQVMINFATKNDFDSLINISNDTLKNEYLSAINYSSYSNVDFFEIEEYKILDCCIKDNLFVLRNQLIKKVMKNKIGAITN